MPAGLRARLALFGMLAAFLIPVGSSSLRGLTHALVCRSRTSSPFTVVVPSDSSASSIRIRRGSNDAICGGLVVFPELHNDGGGRVTVTLPITNLTRYTWRGSVALHVGSAVVPVTIGRIGPRQTVARTVHLTVGPSTTEVHGTLLIGP